MKAVWISVHAPTRAEAEDKILEIMARLGWEFDDKPEEEEGVTDGVMLQVTYTEV